MLKSILTLGAAMGVALGSPAYAAELLVNGGLNSTPTHPASGIPSLAPGSTAIEGWSIFGASDLAWIPAGYSTAAYEGDYYVELMGYTDSAGRYAGISQTVATEVGELYELSFFMGHHPGDAGTIGVLASAGDVAQSFAMPAGTGAWTRYAMNFVATSDSTPISLQGNMGTFHIGVDAVSLNQLSGTVPEPATWAMMLLGFGFVGGMMRSAKRRQRLTVTYA